MAELGTEGWRQRSGRAVALSAIAVLGLAIALCVWLSLGITDPARRPGPSDLDTYERVVAALKAGQGYYPALHDALLAGGYGTLSPLNWRTPAFLKVVSAFASLDAAQLALEALVACAWALAVAFVYRSSGLLTAIFASILLAFSLFGVFAHRAELSFELCAGALVLASAAAYGLNWRWIGIILAVAALFVRELATLYVIACLGSAIPERRWREVVAWLAALVLYAAFYAMHIEAVRAELGPADHAAADWLQWGGLVFVLRTAAFNGAFLALPIWVSALVLPLGLLGLAAGPKAVRATVLAFVLLTLALFLAYGRPENEYWGALYTPVLTLGLVWVPRAIGSLLSAVRPLRSSEA